MPDIEQPEIQVAKGRKEGRSIFGSWEESAPLIRAFALITLIILFIETAIMVVLEPQFQGRLWVGALMDSGTLILLTSPFIYRLLIKPMARNLLEKAVAQRAVQELSDTNQFLRKEAIARADLEALERTRADAKIQLQARILSVVQQAIIATGKGGLIIYSNRHAQWMFGWTEEELKGHTLAQVTSFSLDAARYGLSGFGAVKGWEGEVQSVRRDGSHFPAYLTCSPIWRQDGSVAGFVYTFIDITDRKQAEDAIRESEQKYSTVVENSPTGIFIYQVGKLAYGNARFFQMVGRSAQTLSTMDPADIIHPDDWPRVREAWLRRFRGVSANHDEDCRIYGQRGEIRWVTGRSTVIRYQGMEALLVNLQDITERHNAEQGLKESQEALHKLSARLMTAQESERQRVARELHDSIGQSLSAIKFMVEQALESDQSVERRQSRHALQAVVPVIQASVEEVRRISMDLRPPSLDDLGLLATVAWFVREFQETYPQFVIEKFIEVEEFEIPDELKINIFRILQEAMNNAAKHSRARHITIALRQVMADLQLLIADDGCGYDLATPRVMSTKGGFGQASMRERAELFGGTLIITSEVGQGTMILARWPLPGEDAEVIS